MSNITPITPELNRHKVPTETLRTHPDNVRRGDLDRIAGSLEAFGQIKPIVATLDGVIVAGNHTFLAAEKLGWDEIAAIAVPMDEETALRYLLADNRSSDGSSYDEEGLAAILEELMEIGALAGTGYSPDDVDDAIAAAGAIAETTEQEFDGDYAESPEATAARAQPMQGGPAVAPMRDVVLLYDLDRYAELETAVLRLKREFGIEATRDVIFECVMRTAAAVAGNDDPPVVIPGQTTIDGAVVERAA